MLVSHVLDYVLDYIIIGLVTTALHLLLTNKVNILEKYLDFTDVFSKKLAEVLPKHTKINKYIIKLQKDKQPPYNLIYSLSLVELKTLKIYIKTNLANGFIRPLKSPAGVPIFFIQKQDGSPHLCVNYRELNNLTIKHQYPLLLIKKFLDWLGWAKCFTQLDFTKTYYQIRI